MNEKKKVFIEDIEAFAIGNLGILCRDVNTDNIVVKHKLNPQIVIRFDYEDGGYRMNSGSMQYREVFIKFMQRGNG